MEVDSRPRAQSVVSHRSNPSGLQLRASKLFSKLRFGSKSRQNDSPYMDTPSGQQARRSINVFRPNSMAKPYMSQPVLGLGVDAAMDDDEELHSPYSAGGSNSGTSNGDVSSEPRLGRSTPDRGRMSVDSANSSGRGRQTQPAPSSPKKRMSRQPEPASYTLTAAFVPPANAAMAWGRAGSMDLSKPEQVDGLPESRSPTQDRRKLATADGLPSQSSKRDYFFGKSKEVQPRSADASTTTFKPLPPPSGHHKHHHPSPSRPPPPSPDSSSQKNAYPPDIVVSGPTPQASRSGFSVNRTESRMSVKSDMTASDGYATAPSSPPPPSSPPVPQPSLKTVAEATTPIDDIPSKPPLSTQSSTSTIYKNHSSPSGSDGSTSTGTSRHRLRSPSSSSSMAATPRRSPAPRLTTPLPSYTAPIRTSTLPTVNQFGALTPSGDNLHRRFSTAPGARGSLVFTPTGETARFSPSIITYQRAAPPPLRLPLPDPGVYASSSEEERKGGGRSPGSGLSRVVSESAASATSSRMQRSQLRNIPSMTVGGKMDNGDDGDHDSSDESDGSDEDDIDGEALANEGDDDDETAEGTTTESAAGPSNRPVADLTKVAAEPKRLWSFSSLKSGSNRSTTASSTPKEKEKKSSLPESVKHASASASPVIHAPAPKWWPEVDTSTLDLTSFMNSSPVSTSPPPIDVKGKGKAREASPDVATPTASKVSSVSKEKEQEHNLGRVPSHYRVNTGDYFTSKTPTASPVSSAAWHGWAMKTPRPASTRSRTTPTNGLGDVSHDDVPPVPPIPPSPKMPPRVLHGRDGRPAIYKQASRSMVDITSSHDFDEEEDLVPSPVSPTTKRIDEEPKEQDDVAVGDEAEGAKMKKMGNAPAYETVVARGGTLKRQRSMPTFHPSHDPPPYPDFVPHPFALTGGKISPAFFVQPRDDEGREQLPEYKNDIYVKAIMPRKMEFTAPGVQAKDRKWRRVTCVLEGTMFSVYRTKAGRGVPGGVSALNGWWERTVGAADVSSGSGTVANASTVKAEREREREQSRMMETVRKLEDETRGTGGRGPGNASAELIMPASSTPPSAYSPVSPSQSQSRQGLGQGHGQSQTSLAPPNTSRFSLSKLRSHSRTKSDAVHPTQPQLKPRTDPRASMSSLGRPMNQRSGSSGSNSGEGRSRRESIDVSQSQSSVDSHRSGLRSAYRSRSRASLSISVPSSSTPSHTGHGQMPSSSSSVQGSSAATSSASRLLQPSGSSRMSLSSSSPPTGKGAQDTIPDPEPEDLIRAYTLQHAESGLGNDYTKRRNVIRVRMEGEQFLLQATDVTEVVQWIEGFHSAANVALDLDERPMPRGPLFPRRRRRRRRPTQDAATDDPQTVAIDSSGGPNHTMQL